MLTRLVVRNLAIVDELEIRFDRGLVVLTGETGAGKSLLIDALDLILGGKAATHLMRAGSTRTTVEAGFSPPPMLRQQLATTLSQRGIDCEPDNLVELVIVRELRLERSQLKSSVRLNEHLISLQVLREIAPLLLDIHGQTEFISLLDPRRHIGLLDAFANQEAAAADYESNYREWKQLLRRLEEIRQEEPRLVERLGLLEHQVKELEGVSFAAEDEENLLAERRRLANAQELVDLTETALGFLEGQGTYRRKGDNASDAVHRTVKAVNRIVALDPVAEPWVEQSRLIWDQIADLANALRSYQLGISLDPHRQDAIEERLDTIRRLQRKYGESADERRDFLHRARDERDQIREQLAWLTAGANEADRRREQLRIVGQQLRAARQQAATALSNQVEEQLADLRLAGARFAVSIEPRASVDEPGPHGLDDIQFLLAANTGESLRPLAAVASGGESARLLLAIENVLAGQGDPRTLVFDEIDQGIGARVGQIVGRKLWRLGRHHQVLAVTHLPQVAAFADQHLRVAKSTSAGRTRVEIAALGLPERLDEVAAMFGGNREPERIAAQALLTEVDDWRRAELSQPTANSLPTDETESTGLTAVAKTKSRSRTEPAIAARRTGRPKA